MRLEYENGTLRVENADGLRWQLGDAAKPEFTFPYDALAVGEGRAVRRVGASLHPLALDEIEQVRAFVGQLQPPEWATLHNQITADLRALARGLINSVVTRLEYDGLLDVVITARPDSTDLYAEEARRVLGYVDSVWNGFHALAAQIRSTPAAELKTVKEYAAMMPFPPPADHFSGGVLEELFGGAPGQR
jgi:hypothetical protein